MYKNANSKIAKAAILGALAVTFSVGITSPAFAASSKGGTSTDGTTVTPEDIPGGGSGAAYYPGSSVTVRPGDIMVSNSTSSSGFTGHAGIVVDYSGSVVSIAGYGSYPAKYSLSTWFSRYPNEKVVRLSDASPGQAAATWASNYVVNYSHVPYGISDLALPYKTTYCSKLVWNAYYFGANYTLPYYYNMTFGYNLSAPYDLLRTANSSIVFSNANF